MSLIHSPAPRGNVTLPRQSCLFFPFTLRPSIPQHRVPWRWHSISSCLITTRYPRRTLRLLPHAEALHRRWPIGPKTCLDMQYEVYYPIVLAMRGLSDVLDDRLSCLVCGCLAVMCRRLEGAGQVMSGMDNSVLRATVENWLGRGPCADLWEEP